jgi:hypothetical protein
MGIISNLSTFQTNSEWFLVPNPFMPAMSASLRPSLPVTNTEASKAVKFSGIVRRDGRPIIEVISSFLYRGRFADFNQTLNIIKECDQIVQVETRAALLYTFSHPAGLLFATQFAQIALVVTERLLLKT